MRKCEDGFIFAQISKSEAGELFRHGIPVYVLGWEDTEYQVEDESEFEKNGLSFGIATDFE